MSKFDIAVRLVEEAESRKEREKRMAKNKRDAEAHTARLANMTPEQKAAYNKERTAGNKARWANMTPEQKAVHNKKRNETRKAKWDAMTPEQKEDIRIKKRAEQKKRTAARTPEQKEAFNKKRIAGNKARWANMTPEQKAAHNKERNEARKAARATQRAAKDDPAKTFKETLVTINMDGKMVKTTYRNQALVKAAIEHYGKSCQMCSFKYSSAFNSSIIDKKPTGGFDVHHLIPLETKFADAEEVKQEDGSILKTIETTVDEVIPVCPICHKIAHSNIKETTTKEELKKVASTYRSNQGNSNEVR
jgi:predicted HNH restriction endonuclease